MKDIFGDKVKLHNFMYNIIENMQDMVRVMDSDNNIIFMNRAMRERFGDRTGFKCYQMICVDKPCEDCICKESISSKCSRSKEVELQDDGIFRVTSASFDADRQNYAIEVFKDISVQKSMEKGIYEQYLKMKSDIEFAKQVQNSIMPQNKIHKDSIKLTSSYIPSEEMSGDSLDIFEMNKNTLAFYISDVSGHGITASILTMFLRQVIRGLKDGMIHIGDIVNEIIDQYKQLNLGAEHYFTLLYVMYDLELKEMTLINAGHNCLPLLITKEGEVREIEVKGMPICFLAQHNEHEVAKIKLKKGDRVLFYTDGITEVYDESKKTFLGRDGLIEICSKGHGLKSDQLLQSVVETVKNYSFGGIRDDIAMAIIDIL